MSSRREEQVAWSALVRGHGLLAQHSAQWVAEGEGAQIVKLAHPGRVRSATHRAHARADVSTPADTLTPTRRSHDDSIMADMIAPFAALPLLTTLYLLHLTVPFRGSIRDRRALQ